MKNNLLYLVITTFFLFSNEFILTQPLPPKLPDVGATVMRLPKLIEESSINLKAPKGFEVELFAENLSSPRWLLVLPNDNILVAQSRTESLPGLPPETVKILSKMNLNFLYFQLRIKNINLAINIRLVESFALFFGIMSIGAQLQKQ